MDKILEKALKANVARTEIAGKYNTKWTPDAIDKVEEEQGELFSYEEFGDNWDKKFGEGEFARFEKKWNKRFGSPITLDNQLKQKVDSQPDFFDSLPTKGE